MTRIAMLFLFGLSTLMIGCDSPPASNETPVPPSTATPEPPKPGAKSAAPAAPAPTQTAP